MSEKAYAAVALLAVALGVLLNLPSLDAGLAADDFLQRAMLEGHYPVGRSALDLYSFVDGADELAKLVEAGTLPWWSDPELRLSALRPLSSLTIALDERVLGLSARAQHVHSLAWFALLVAGFAALAGRIAPRGTAALAVLLFAIDPVHVMPIGWLANRTALISACLGVLGLWAHLKFREQAWRPGAALAALGFSLALAAGEYALSIIVYLVVYELGAGPGSLKTRVLASATGLVPALGYLLAHVALGYGATGSAVYVDPLSAPAKFVFAALVRTPALIGSDLTLLPPEVLHGASAAAGLFGWLLLLALLAPLVALVPGALGRYPAPQRQKLRAFALGAALSLVPLAGTLPSSRLLLVPSVGGSLVLSALIVDAALGVRSAERRRRPTTWLRVAAALGLILLHVGFAPLATWAGARGWRDLHARLQRTYLTAPIDDRGVEERTLVLVNAVEPMSLISPPYVRARQGHTLPKRWRVLSITHRRQRLERVADDTLELTVAGGGMLEDPVSQLFRALEHPLRQHQRVVLSDLTIEVVELSEWGPKRVRYRFKQSLDHPSIVVLALKGGALRRLAPLRIGQTLEIPPG